MRKINEGTRKLVKRLREKESEEKLEDFFKEINKLAVAPIGIAEESIKGIEGKVGIYDMRGQREKVKEVKK